MQSVHDSSVRPLAPSNLDLHEAVTLQSAALKFHSRVSEAAWALDMALRNIRIAPTPELRVEAMKAIPGAMARVRGACASW